MDSQKLDIRGLEVGMVGSKLGVLDLQWRKIGNRER